jgi:catechol 2,3-dioxygenase-like lactoylglutathione lyase family enzyme
MGVVEHFTCRYLALYVSELEAAESFYRDVFGLELLFREHEGDGSWATLRPELDWAEARERGLGIDMVALRRDGFVLALFRGDPAPDTVYEICVEVPAEEVQRVRERLPAEATVTDDEPHSMRFVDAFGFRWAVHAPHLPFRSSGETAGRWIG